MNRKFKLILATLLGFSAACSSVKNLPVKGEPKIQSETDSVGTEVNRRIVVMYGVRPPQAVIDRNKGRSGDLDPVAERPEVDSIASSGTKRAPEVSKPATK